MTKILPIFELINKTSEYLEYVEDHVKNVQKAWEVLKKKCHDMRFIWDDFYYFTILSEIESHDISKLSEQEFVQYRKSFYPAEFESKYVLDEAWEHHKKNNRHHWENWTTMETVSFPDEWEIHCAHMICDWMAMGYKFGDTPRQYYEKNADKIKIPGYAIDFIYEIFNKIEK